MLECGAQIIFGSAYCPITRRLSSTHSDSYCAGGL
jgi:hypothetical protein